jgi:hypothetical protein
MKYSMAEGGYSIVEENVVCQPVAARSCSMKTASAASLAVKAYGRIVLKAVSLKANVQKI